jgi:phage tail sheath gpL-like
MYVTRLQVRPGGQPAIEGVIRKVTEASQKIGAPRKVSISSTVIGEQGEYYIVQPIRDPAELDQMKSPAEVLAEAFGEKEGGAILAQSAAVLERVTTMLVTPRPDLSNVG